jgi:two-component system nitrogen regulation response regulator NtrX
MIGVSEAVQQLDMELRQAARSDAKTLLTGESGVGKEVAARLLHKYSARSHRPFVAMNCAGVPDSLLESELFGHVRGSFTGAYRDKPGILEQAHGGTVLLDEVGEMSLRMQALLLRFLEDGQIHRVGSERTTANVDVRVVAATNRVLTDRITGGFFREDLYYRLNVIHLIIPPLRDRREDITPLIEHYLKGFADKYAVPVPGLSPEALAVLFEHDWPGNVRELKNLAERLVVRSRGTVISAQDVTTSMVAGTRPSPAMPAAAAAVAATATTARPSVAFVSRPPASDLFDRIVKQRESFWSAVYGPFMTRDLTRADVRSLVSAGLQHTRGNYKMLLDLFNMDRSDYKRFLNFLRKHHCHVPFQQFRSGDMLRAYPPAEQQETEIA